MSIIVLNPPEGGKRFTSRTIAEREVKARNARWNADQSGIWYKRTGEVLERFKRQLETNAGREVKWVGRQSGKAGPRVMQLVRRRK